MKSEDCDCKLWSVVTHESWRVRVRVSLPAEVERPLLQPQVRVAAGRGRDLRGRGSLVTADHWANKTQPNQTKSYLTKPNQTFLNQTQSKQFYQTKLNQNQPNQIKLNQTKPNQTKTKPYQTNPN